MKVNNLLKKVGSVITTAALLATLGTTAFAAGENVSTKPGKGISITSVTTTKVDDNGLYNVKVEYATTVDNVTGMTMLAYRAKDSSGNPSDTALGTAYSSDMQIVGIDQKEPVKNNSGSFEFKVTTNTDANGFYIQKGKKALIAVSGDQCEPAYATLLIKLAAKEITSKTLDKAVSVAANASDVDIQSALNAAAEKATVSVIDDVDGEHQVSLSLADIKAANWTLGEDGKYTKTYTFKAGNTSVEGVEFKEDKTVKVTATITKTAVDADRITAIEGMTATTVEGDTVFTGAYTPNDSTTLDTIKNELVGKNVTLADSTGTVTGKIVIADEMIHTEDVYNAGLEEQDITFTVKVDAGAELDNNLLNVSGAKEATVKIKVSKTAVVNKIELVGNDISVNATKGEDDDATKANIIKALGEKLSNEYTFKLTDTKNNVTENVAVGEVEKAWTIEGTGTTFTATLKVTAITKEGFTTKLSEGGVVVTFAKAPVITVTEAPKGMYGDLVGDYDAEGNEIGDGEILPNDVSAVFLASKGKKTLTAQQMWAADVATKPADGEILPDDVSYIFLASKGKLPGGKFPVQD